MSIPCHEGPPATRGHFCSEPAVAGGGRYYCTRDELGRKLVAWRASYCLLVKGLKVWKTKLMVGGGGVVSELGT